MYEPADAGALHVELADAATSGRALPRASPRSWRPPSTRAPTPCTPATATWPRTPTSPRPSRRPASRWVGPPPGGDARARRQDRGPPAGRGGRRRRSSPGYAGDDLSDAALAPRGRRSWDAPLLVKAAAGGGGRGMRAVDDVGGIRAARRLGAARGGRRVRRRPRLPGAAPDGRPPRRGAGARRRPRRLHPPGRARLLAAAPPPEDRRGGALPGGRRRPARARSARPRVAIARGRPATAAPARSSSCVAGDGSWCFLELNARLQVEHPVTEAVTGIDLVRAQLEIASRRAARARRRPTCALRGHAIEAALYAEDPGGGLPAGDRPRWSGCELPAWPGVRVDAGVREGDEVGAALRPAAREGDRPRRGPRRLHRAAARRRSPRRRVLGVTTNLGFLRWLLEQPGVPGRRGGHRTSSTRSGGRARAAAARRRPPERRWPPAMPAIWHACGPRRPGVRGRPAAGSPHRGWHSGLAADDGAAGRSRPPGGSLHGADAGHRAAGGRAPRASDVAEGDAARRARGDEDGARGVGARGGDGARRCTWRRATWSSAGRRWWSSTRW